MNNNTNNVNDVMDTTLDKIKSMVDVNTIVGEPIFSQDNTMIVPISKVSFGFFSAGGEMDAKKKNYNSADSSEMKKDYPFAGGAGAGVSLSPIGFIVARNNSITMLPVNYNSSVERLIETLPDTVSQLRDAIRQ